jgi:hypothetical protein
MVASLKLLFHVGSSAGNGRFDKPLAIVTTLKLRHLSTYTQKFPTEMDQEFICEILPHGSLVPLPLIPDALKAL